MDTEELELEEEKTVEQKIDYKALWAAIKKRKKAYWVVLPITFVVACVIALSLPNYYICQVQLAPELTMNRSANSLSSLAAQFGLKMGTAATGNSEALYPALYPDLVNSTDFKVTLFDVPVHKKDSTNVMTYYDYLKDHQKSPWWAKIIGGTMKMVTSLIPSKNEEATGNGATKVDPFQLTKEQTGIVKVMESKVLCDVDNKTLVVTLQVSDQDSLICATVADSVKMRLLSFITEYRTQKARVNLEYTRKLYDEAKVLYDKARRSYAEYSDAHQDIIYQTDRTTLNNLENEMQLRYNTYNALAQQLTTADAQLLQETPSFTTLQSATVPVQKAGPSRSKLVLILLFGAFVCTTVWILYKEEQLKPLLGQIMN